MDASPSAHPNGAMAPLQSLQRQRRNRRGADLRANRGSIDVTDFWVVAVGRRGRVKLVADRFNAQLEGIVRLEVPRWEDAFTPRRIPSACGSNARWWCCASSMPRGALAANQKGWIQAIEEGLAALPK
jgi:hypothetical protein